MIVETNLFRTGRQQPEESKNKITKAVGERGFYEEEKHEHLIGISNAGIQPCSGRSNRPGGRREKDKYVIGMSQCNLGEPWRVAMNDQIAAAAEKYPEFEVIFADAAQDNPSRLQTLRILYRWA